ncbi:MAG: hypothetical protein K0Q72_1166 [Armatimonadetes bacterium]|nr:hypothetical protein [Armatimonadota bacterium]
MKISLSLLALAGLVAVGAGVIGARLAPPAAAAGPKIELVRPPDGGLQCQAATDAAGVVHLVYLKGPASASDVYYARRSGSAWTTPLRVNSKPGSAVATGTIRGPQLALGRKGRVHVVWFGSAQSGARGPDDSAPLLYSRLNEAGAAFEPQRNLMQGTAALDGGPGIAADPAGNVYVAWQAATAGAKSAGEDRRQLWIARSGNDGERFTPELAAWSEPTGACPCCSTEAFVDSKGTLYVQYRMSSNRTQRDMVLLVSTDRGRTFRGRRVDPWPIDACPMSSEAFAEGGGALVAAWETQGQVKFSRVQPGTAQFAPPVSAPGAGGTRKHPVLAVNGNGEVLFAWTEGTGWNRGGSLAWQLYDASGRPTSQGRQEGGIPVWGLAAAAARPDGTFLLIH